MKIKDTGIAQDKVKTKSTKSQKCTRETLQLCSQGIAQERKKYLNTIKKSLSKKIWISHKTVYKTTKR
jgi:tetrahydrodipicolinate N-succinyltransferase